uniref:H/ACA RNA-protein complex protein Gar1 n=1 Tax=Geoglobus ahangari TaxID=113653 RepID=A0A7C3YEB0_9EURY
MFKNISLSKTLYTHVTNSPFVLKLVGRILHISKMGNIIAKGDPKNLPRIGEEVYDSRMEKIGVVYDIIGSVNSPYIVVKPLKKKFVEDNLFTVVKNGRSGKGKGKGGRKRGKGEGNREKGNRKRRNY